MTGEGLHNNSLLTFLLQVFTIFFFEIKHSSSRSYSWAPLRSSLNGVGDNNRCNKRFFFLRSRKKNNNRLQFIWFLLYISWYSFTSYFFNTCWPGLKYYCFSLSLFDLRWIVLACKAWSWEKKSENPAQFNRNAGLKWNFEKILTPQTKKKEQGGQCCGIPLVLTKKERREVKAENTSGWPSLPIRPVLLG